MTDNAYPSADPADEDNLAGVLRATFRKFLQQTDNMLPAVVVAFDRNKNRATVVPCVTALTTDGRVIPRAQVASVPVMQFGGGGFVLNFNLKAGDFGWLHANDRDTSNFLQSFRTSPPNTLRLHSFQDGVFIPEVMRGWVLAGEDSEAAVLQTLDGVTRVAVDVGRIKLTSGASTVTVTPDGVTVESAAVTINGPTTITGGLTVDGIVFGTHVHSGVTPGGANTGAPV